MLKDTLELKDWLEQGKHWGYGRNTNSYLWAGIGPVRSGRIVGVAVIAGRHLVWVAPVKWWRRGEE